ncbi:hypothetical protein KI387_022978, partial [Taxus chinensis]
MSSSMSTTFCLLQRASSGAPEPYFAVKLQVSIGTTSQNLMLQSSLPGILPIAHLFKNHGIVLNFACFEMKDYEQPQHARCSPEGLLRQVTSICTQTNVCLVRENALQRYDDGAYSQIIHNSNLQLGGNSEHNAKPVSAVTFLRIMFCTCVESTASSTPSKLTAGLQAPAHIFSIAVDGVSHVKNRINDRFSGWINYGARISSQLQAVTC